MEGRPGGGGTGRDAVTSPCAKMEHHGWSVLGAVAWACFMSVSFALFGDSPADEPPRYCTVFNHFVKSGGSSIKQQLNHGCKRAKNRRPDVFIGVSRSTPLMLLNTIHNASVIVGNAEMIREPMGGINRTCDFFTMMRSPIDRLISAFYYCPHDHDIQNRPSKYCGGSKGEKEPIQDRLLQFAKLFWGNRAFRSMMGSISCNTNSELCDPNRARKTPPRPRNIDTADGWLLHDSVKRILSTYTAVGIFEEWELSMRLFDAKVTSPVRSWDVKVVANPGNKSSAREELLDWAYTNADLHNILAADMLLYDYALALFRQQTNDASLM